MVRDGFRAQGTPMTASERTLGDIVRDRRRALELTLQGLAERVGCTKGYLSTIENGRALPAPELREAIGEALSLEAGALARAAAWQTTPPGVRHEVARLRRQQAIGRELAELIASAGERPGRSLDDLHRTGRLRELVDRLAGDDRGASVVEVALPVEVPLINSVQAGYPTEFTDLGYPARVADEYVRSPDIHDPDAFAARVVGDSMAPEYVEGDIVVFSPARDARPGDDCFARLGPDDETTFKRVYFEGQDGVDEAVDDARIRLQPLNSAYPPQVFPRERVVGLYPAVSVIRDLRR